MNLVHICIRPMKNILLFVWSIARKTPKSSFFLYSTFCQKCPQSPLSDDLAEMLNSSCYMLTNLTRALNLDDCDYIYITRVINKWCLIWQPSRTSLPLTLALERAVGVKGRTVSSAHPRQCCSAAVLPEEIHENTANGQHGTLKSSSCSNEARRWCSWPPHAT